MYIYGHVCVCVYTEKIRKAFLDFKAFFNLPTTGSKSPNICNSYNRMGV